MRDFTIPIYRELLNAIGRREFQFQTFENFINRTNKSKTIVLRHDVDARKKKALMFASIQYELGIQGTYYFRIIPQSFDKGLVREISSMGHEIGYHYEDMDLAKGDPHVAINLFKKHLAVIREIAPVSTICMHGSPLSRFDNKDLWKYYNYSDYGIIAEPYFDLDFSEVLYLTDTGRRWNGDRVSIRDRAGDSEINKFMKDGKESLSYQYSFRSTKEIIMACNQGDLPDQIMFNFHPQRWINDPILWTYELLLQNVKNVFKKGLNLKIR